LSVIETKSVFTNAYLDILSGRAAIYSRHNEEVMLRVQAAGDGCVTIERASQVPDTIVIPIVRYPWTWCPMSARAETLPP
jgi:hypothetical protein